jgi:hypothetical protein
MGLGQKFDLPFGTQRYGTVPDSAWKLKKLQGGLDGGGFAQRVDRPGLCARQSAAARGDGGAHRAGRALVPRLLLPRRTPAPSLAIDAEHLAIVRDACSAVINGGGTGGAARMPIPGVDAGRQDRHRAGPRITMAERARACSRTLAAVQAARPRAVRLLRAVPTIRAMPPRSCSSITAIPGPQSRHADDRPRHHDLPVRPRAGDGRSRKSSRPGAATIPTRLAASRARHSARAQSAPAPPRPRMPKRRQQRRRRSRQRHHQQRHHQRSRRPAARSATNEHSSAPASSLRRSRSCRGGSSLLVFAVGMLRPAVLYSAAGGSMWSPGRFRRACASSISSAMAIVLSRVPESFWALTAFPVYGMIVRCWSASRLLGAGRGRQPALARPRHHPPPAFRADEADDRAHAGALLRDAARGRDTQVRRDLAGRVLIGLPAALGDAPARSRHRADDHRLRGDR